MWATFFRVAKVRLNPNRVYARQVGRCSTGELVGHTDPGNALEGRQPESEPPEPCRADGDPGGQGRVDRDEAIAELDQSERQEEMQPATEVAPGKSSRADHVDGFVRGEVGEEGVVEDVGADEPEVGEKEEPKSEHHVTRGGEEEEGREDGAPRGENHEEAPFRSREVGDGAEHRCGQEHDQWTCSHDEGPQVLTGPVSTEQVEPGIADDLGSEVGREHRGEDRRGVRRVGPVVGDPGPDAARIVLVLGGHDWRNLDLACRRCAAF